MALFSKRSREGYLLVDHQASPGLPPEVARLSGYDPRFCGEGAIYESATLTCGHCKVSVVKNPLRTRPRHECPRCDHYICDLCFAASCAPDYQHRPFDQYIDDLLAHSEVLGSPPALLLSSTPSPC